MVFVDSSICERSHKNACLRRDAGGRGNYRSKTDLILILNVIEFSKKKILRRRRIVFVREMCKENYISCFNITVKLKIVRFSCSLFHLNLYRFYVTWSQNFSSPFFFDNRDENILIPQNLIKILFDIFFLAFKRISTAHVNPLN